LTERGGSCIAVREFLYWNWDFNRDKIIDRNCLNGLVEGEFPIDPGETANVMTRSMVYLGSDGASGAIFRDETDGSHMSLSDNQRLEAGEPLPETQEETLPLESDQPQALDGTPDDDVLVGTAGDDIMLRLEGDDIIAGEAGDDLPQIFGVLRSISAYRLVDEVTGEPFFLAKVEVDPEELARIAPEIELGPGMPADVMILTGERTLLSYLGRPFLQSITRSFREQ
jgi:hypothetical protein